LKIAGNIVLFDCVSIDVVSAVVFLYPTKSLTLPSLQSIAAMPKMSDSRIRPTPSLLSSTYMDV
jgi:hypothetical protein